MTSWRVFRGRRFQRGSQAAVSLAAFLGILILLNVLAAKVSWRVDTTSASLYSLSEQTRTVMAGLDTPIKITAFIREDAKGLQVKDFLRQYSHASKNVSVSFVDPVTSPSAARKRNVDKFNTIIVEAKGREKMIEPTNLFVPTPDNKAVEFRGEQPVTQAIIQLSSDVTPKIYFTQGHGEPILDGRQLFRVFSNLQGEGYAPEPLNISEKGAVPADAALVAVVGPDKDLLPREREALSAYLEKGGRLLLLLDPITEELKEWNGLVRTLGLDPQEDVVVDPERAFFMDNMRIMPQIHLHSITKGILKRRLPVVVAVARSFDEIRAEEGLTVTSLLVSSGASWGETDFRSTPSKGEGDLEGPLTIAAAVSRPVPGAPKRSEEEMATEAPGDAPQNEERRVAVVVGNSAFIIEDALDFPGNLDFIMNSVNWLLGQDNLITTRPKYMELRPANLTPPEAARVFYGTVVAMPLLAALAGAVVWWRRRWL